MASSNGNIFRITGPLCEEFTGHRWIPQKGQWRRALMYSLVCAWINGWVKQPWGWWFETPSRSLWRHCNAKCFQVLFFLTGMPSYASLRCPYDLCTSEKNVTESGLVPTFSKYCYHELALWFVETYHITKFIKDDVAALMGSLGKRNRIKRSRYRPKG